MAAHSGSILLVDDFEDGLEMYAQYLAYRGYRVIPARNGKEAIQLARLHRPDVILLDIRMPGMTGTDVMRALRTDYSFAHVPIIALTAQALDKERVAALDAGFDDLIPKPCIPDQLVLAVERILATGRARRTCSATSGDSARSLRPSDVPADGTNHVQQPAVVDRLRNVVTGL